MIPWTLASARLRNNLLRTLSYSFAVALGFLSLLTIQGISYSTGNSLVSYSLSKLPTGDRALTLTSNNILSRQQNTTIDKYLAKYLSGLDNGKLSREFIFQELSDSHGTGFNIAGVENLANSIVLQSGRMPKSCNFAPCEVIQVGGASNSKPRVGNFGISIVGSGRLRDPRLFTGGIGPSDGTPILITNGLGVANSLPSLQNRQGLDAWVGEINLGRISMDGPKTYINSMLAFENQLSLDHPEMTLTWPQDALGTASDQSKSISGTFVLLDFVVAAFLVAFLILFSLRHRRQHQHFREGLSRIGTPKRLLAEELTFEYGAPLVLGLLIASLASFIIPTGLSKAHFHVSIWQLYVGWPKYLFLALAALGLLIGAAITNDKSWRRDFWIPYFLGLLCLAEYLHRSGNQELRSWFIPIGYTLLPAILIFYLLRIVSSLLRRRKNPTYVLFREQLSIWQGVAAILTLASILAVLALSFDSGISRMVISRSRDTVPLDISLRTGSELVRPLDLGGIKDYEKLGFGAHAYPILRSGTAVRNQNSVSDTLTLIGIPPQALTALPDVSLHHLATTLGSGVSTSEIGINLGLSKQIDVTLANIPKEIDLFGWLRTPNGTHLSAMFSGHTELRRLLLPGTIPVGSSIVAFEFRETSDYLSRRLHAMGEGSFAVPMLKGVGSISSVVFDGHVQTLSERSWHLKNFPYAFNGGGLFVRPEVKLGIPLVVVDPTTALLARNGLLTLSGATDGFFQVRVGAVVKAFPSAEDRFVIMDLVQLQNEIGQSDLGAIDPIELWISTPDPSAYLKNLQASRFQGLQVQGRNSVEKVLRSDPTNVGLSGSYKTSLLFALLLAIYMYLSALPLLYKEGTNVLFHLEATGVGPRELRRALRVSMRMAITVALLTGTLLGLFVAHFFISDSTPYIFIVISFAASLCVSEIGGYLFTRKLFVESSMTRSAR